MTRPAPLRQSPAAGALIERQEAGERLWLARWYGKWGAYHLVAGHKEPAESFRRCVRRAVNEELGLCEPADFTIAEKPAARLEYIAFSRSAGVETCYRMELFAVQLIGCAIERLEQQADVRWLTEEEIRASRATDRQPVSETMVRLLTGAKRLSR